MPITSCGIDCTNCGLTSGTIETGGNARCDDCGQFAEKSSEYCARHGINVRNLSGYDECPRCRQERDMEAREQEQLARRADPNMHNSVDAQANAIDHSRGPSDFM